MRARLFIIALVALGGMAVPVVAQNPAPFNAIDLRTALDPAALAARLDEARVVFVGETHTRYADHLNQLAIIEQLHARRPNLAIGVEYFPRQSQTQVDDYIAGRTSEQQFLRDTGYFREWGYDYRLYAPIFRYARTEHIPVRALNVPLSLPSAVARLGLGGLAEAERAELPREIEPADDAYRERLRQAFQPHQGHVSGTFDHFVEAQLVWDEGMAESAATYLEANPGRPMVILAGSGHLAFGSGIPQRLERRTHLPYKIVLNDDGQVGPQAADYLLLSEDQELPAAGILGVDLQDLNGTCRIRAVSPASPAAQARLKVGDIIMLIGGQPIKSAADVRLALWDKKPGDSIQLEVRRKHLFTSTRTLNLKLGTSAPQQLFR